VSVSPSGVGQLARAYSTWRASVAFSIKLFGAEPAQAPSRLRQLHRRWAAVHCYHRAARSHQRYRGLLL